MNEKILITSAISKRHDYCLDNWYKSIKQYKDVDYDILLIDNTLDNGEYYNELKERYPDIIILRYVWDNKKDHMLKMMANVREISRVYFIKHLYTHIFFIDCDITIYPEYLKKLMDYNLDRIGPIIHVFYRPTDVPCILKDGFVTMGKGLSYYNWREVINSKEKLVKVHGNAFGCSLIKRKVMENCKFRSHPSFMYGEDLWFNTEMNDKGYECWVDMNYKALHNNTTWNDVIKKDETGKSMKFWIAHGSADATEVEFVERIPVICDE